MSKSVLCLVVVQFLFQLSSAYEFCGNGYYCPDEGNDIRYCCGTDWSGVALCCSYYEWYEMWYVWLGVGLFLSILGSVIAACVRKRRREEAMRRRAVVVTRPVTVTSVSNSTTYGFGNQNYGNNPPSYADVTEGTNGVHPPTNPNFNQNNASKA